VHDPVECVEVAGKTEPVEMGAKALQRIMVADDEPDILEISRIALESLGGYEVATCRSGVEFFRVLPDFVPDLVILDVMMPDMPGLEIYRTLRKMREFEDVVVVFLTGLIGHEELEYLRRSGEASIIRKPFDPMAFADRVGTIWSDRNGP
jgi:two-component system, OmpR family, response regulator